MQEGSAMVKQFLTVGLVAAALHTGARVAAAQSIPAVDFTAGYLNVSGTMHGVNGQVAVSLSRGWTLLGEVNSSRGHDPGDTTYTYRDLGVLGGARYTWSRSRVSPFAQLLAGGLQSKGAGEPCYIFSGCEHREYTVDYFAVQPGGGVLIMLTERYGIRAQADLQLAIPDQSKFEGMSLFPRVVVGAVVRLGRR
jgi:hypothetical protein